MIVVNLSGQPERLSAFTFLSSFLPLFRPVRGAPVSSITTNPTYSRYPPFDTIFNVGSFEIYSPCGTRSHSTNNSSLFFSNPRRRHLSTGFKLQRWQPNAEGMDRRLDWHFSRSQRCCLEHKTFLRRIQSCDRQRRFHRVGFFSP